MNAWQRFLVCLFILAALLGCEESEGRPAPEPSSGAASAQAARRCEHGLPRALCPKCDPALVAVLQAKGDWCAEHGFPESACPICNPEVHAQKPAVPGTSAGEWCAEHGLPESKCTKCNPRLVAQFQAKGDWCAEHGFPESACPICNPQPATAGAEQAALEARVVRFRSPAIEQTAGIQTVAAQRTQSSASVECTARIAFDGDRVADIRAIVPGIIQRVRAELGASVARGLSWRSRFPCPCCSPSTRC